MMVAILLWKPWNQRSLRAEGETKDSNDGSTPMKGEVLPSGSSPEVDTERTAADEARPLAGKKEGPEPLEHKMDDLVGLRHRILLFISSCFIQNTLFTFFL